eukprot:scaffold95023_cov15-Tisochrysis_lutea.AAC.1
MEGLQELVNLVFGRLTPQAAFANTPTSTLYYSYQGDHLLLLFIRDTATAVHVQPVKELERYSSCCCKLTTGFDAQPVGLAAWHTGLLPAKGRFRGKCKETM